MASVNSSSDGVVYYENLYTTNSAAKRQLTHPRVV